MATQNGGYFMCGITGMIHLEQDLRQQEALLRKMQETLRRRGPDQEGIFLSPRCAMAHTRLAVIDVEKGRQPMEITAGGETYTIVYNGELYNTPEPVSYTHLDVYKRQAMTLPFRYSPRLAA